MKNISATNDIEQQIYLVRGHRVMIDRDLAKLYGVETKHLNRQVRRNIERFPIEFMFRLEADERDELVTNCHRFKSMKHSSVPPLAFTEHGVAMLASVLKSERAVLLSIGIIKTFVRLRRMAATQTELAGKLAQLEARMDKNDATVAILMKAIRGLMEVPAKPPRRIGFQIRSK